MDSYALYKKANNLVKQCGTRNALNIAKEIGIKVYYEPTFDIVVGMYTYRWNHRLMFLNPHIGEELLQMVAAHELGHDSEHRELAKAEKQGLREFALFHMKDTTEYEANAFASHILLDNDEVYSLSRQGYDVVEIARMMKADINLMLIKLQEMNKIGYDFRIPMDPDSRFFRKVPHE